MEAEAVERLIHSGPYADGGIGRERLTLLRWGHGGSGAKEGLSVDRPKEQSLGATPAREKRKRTRGPLRRPGVETHHKTVEIAGKGGQDGQGG